MNSFKSLRLNKGKMVALIVATGITMFINSGITYTGDKLLEDLIFQTATIVDDSIVVIGIDEKAIEQFGAWPWDRKILAEVINILNEDEAIRPSAIGVDVIFAGESKVESDLALSNAAKEGNVVVATNAIFKDQFEKQQGGASYINEFHIESIVEPYEELKNYAMVGHINAMYDKDGVLRRHLWSITDPQGDSIISFPYAMYTLYNGHRGIVSDFRPQLDERGFWYVDFPSKPGDLLVYSVADIINRQYDPNLLDGAAVFIGPYDSGLGDDFITAADRSERMYGVEYMANVMRSMVNGVSPYEIPDNIQLIILFIMTYLISLMFYEMEPKYSMVWFGLLGGFSLFGSVFFYNQGFIIHPLWFFVGVVVGFVTSIGGHYYSVKSEKKYIKSTFEKYVDSEIINELLKEGTGGINLGGYTVNIAVMFVDIRGFTSMSEQLEPTEVVDILNEYLSFVSKFIKNNGGTLDKFIGDCAMAFWGAPLECENSVYKACKTACEMVNQSESLQSSIKDKYNIDLAFGIGIHYGSAVVGNIGTTTRMDYTAIGDTVNTASRIQSIAPKGKICISKEVANALGERGSYSIFEEKQKLKGKEEYMEVLLLEDID